MLFGICYQFCTYIFFIIFVTLFCLFYFFSFFSFFFSLTLYFWNSKLYSRFLIFAFRYLLPILYLQEPNFQYPFFTWEWDYWLDCSLPLWTLLFLQQVACVSSLTPLYFIQLCEFLCVPDGGEHLGNWLLAGSVSLLFIPPFYPPGHLCLLPPSSLLCITPWTSLSSPVVECTQGSDYWLARSLLYWFHLISFGSPLTPSSLFSSPCNSVNLSGWSSRWRNFSSLT